MSDDPNQNPYRASDQPAENTSQRDIREIEEDDGLAITFIICFAIGMMLERLLALWWFA